MKDTREATTITARDVGTIDATTGQVGTVDKVDKFARLRELSTAMGKERDAILTQVAPLREKRDAIVAKIQPLEAELRTVDKQIRALTQPALADLDNQIAGLARAMGARSLAASVEAPAETAEGTEAAPSQ